MYSRLFGGKIRQPGCTSVSMAVDRRRSLALSARSYWLAFERCSNYTASHSHCSSAAHHTDRCRANSVRYAARRGNRTKDSPAASVSAANKTWLSLDYSLLREAFHPSMIGAALALLSVRPCWLDVTPATQTRFKQPLVVSSDTSSAYSAELTASSRPTLATAATTVCS